MGARHLRAPHPRCMGNWTRASKPAMAPRQRADRVMASVQWVRHEPQPDTPSLWQRRWELLGAALCGVGLAAILATGLV